MYIGQVADRGDQRPSDRFPRRKPTSSSNPFYSRGNLPLSGADKKKKKKGERWERGQERKKR